MSAFGIADDAETGEISPEQFLDIFEHCSRDPETRSDAQFTAWMDLCSKQTVTQSDLNELVDRFAGPAVAGVEGMRLYDLWLHVVRWGEDLGLSVPHRSPWHRS